MPTATAAPFIPTLIVRCFLLAIIHKFPNNMMVTVILLSHGQATIHKLARPRLYGANHRE